MSTPSQHTSAPIPMNGDGSPAPAGTGEAAPHEAPGGPPAPSPDQAAQGRPARGHHTRISGAWASVALGVALCVALVDFILENTRSVHVDFFSASGDLPIAVALLAAAAAGAAVVLTVGVCRTAQLRLVLRRERRRPPGAPQEAARTS